MNDPRRQAQKREAKGLLEMLLFTFGVALFWSAMVFVFIMFFILAIIGLGISVLCGVYSGCGSDEYAVMWAMIIVGLIGSVAMWITIKVMSRS